MSDAYLSVSGLRKTFGRTVAVDHVDLELPKGAFLALLGPSGCGKTTLLRMLAGFERPDEGTITLGGRPLVAGRKHLPPEKRRVGLVFQEYALFPHLNVEANVGFGVRSRRNRAGKVGEMLELVGLQGLGKRMPHELSGGQQQRVALARTLATEPELVLLDEPFSNLDPTLRARVRGEVWQILRNFNATAIVVTHDQEEAFSLPGLVGVMLEGRLLQVDSPADLYQSPVNRDVAAFVGDANFLRGERRHGTVESQLGPVSGHGLDGAVEIMVRPEDIMVDGDSAIRGEVLACEFYGHDQVVQVRLTDGEVVRVRVLSGDRFNPGDVCGLRLRQPAKVYAVDT